MALELKYEKEDEIPEGMESLYTEKDGVWNLTGVKGMKTQEDVDNVKDSLTKEREAHKETKGKLKDWGELDPEETKATIAEVEELRVKLTDAGEDKHKIDEKVKTLVEQQLAQKLAPVEKERNELKDQLATVSAETETLKTSIAQRDIRETVRQAAIDAKVAPEAMGDVVTLASGWLEADDNGKLMVKDGIAGATPGLDVAGLFTELKDKKPYYWPSSKGGGSDDKPAGGGKVTGFDGVNPWSRDGWNLSEQFKVTNEFGAEMADKLAKAVGSSVDAVEPPPAPTA